MAGFLSRDGRYRITTAENVAQGLPLPLIYTTSRAMLRDRVKALREANIYEGQRYRHVLGMPLIAAGESGAVRARTNFMVARVMRSGETMLFATGCYEDRVTFNARRSRCSPRRPSSSTAARSTRCWQFRCREQRVLANSYVLGNQPCPP